MDKEHLVTTLDVLPTICDYMFFDLDADPGEMNNLAGKEALAGELERHRKLLTQWKELTEEVRYPVERAPETGKGRRKNRAANKKPVAGWRRTGGGTVKGS